MPAGSESYEMPLESGNTIDLARKTADGDVVMTIVDAGVTTDPSQRFELLMRKLRVYVNYVLSDDFATDVPGVTPAQVSIEVVTSLPATPQMLQIDGVRPRSHPDLVIPVRFVMHPDAAPAEDGVPADLSALVYRAVALALGALGGDDATKAILAVGDEGLSVAVLPDFPDAELAFELMRESANDPAQAVAMVAMVGLGRVEGVDVLAIEAAARGDGDAWVYAQPVVREGEGWRADGSLRVIQQRPNDWFD